MRNNSYWVTWEDHRRSRELAKAFDVIYFPLLKSGSRFVRYPVLMTKTILFLIAKRPRVLFCQNPSVVLASVLGFLKIIFGYTLVVDRHSNFKFSTLSSQKLKWRVFHFLSDYSIRRADLTIITNDFLNELVEKKGGRGFILQDKLPDLPLAKSQKLKGSFNVVFVCTYSEDEPFESVIAAGRHVPSDYVIYVTGNYKKCHEIVSGKIIVPDNVVLTGFLSESDYQSLIASADLILVITTENHTLTCGAYEAVSLEKPMVLSDTPAIKNYFKMGALYTGSSQAEIVEKIVAASLSVDKLSREVRLLKTDISEDWNARFQALRANLGV